MTFAKQTPDEYAWGKNTVGDCACPAMAAGRNPAGETGGLLAVAERYDDAVGQTQDNSYEGIVTEQVARDQWLNVLEFYEDVGREEEAQAAREVAETLGWLNE